MDNWARPFLRSMLSESDGNVSSTRFCMILVVLFALGWVTALVVHSKSMPDLGPVGTFVTVVCGTLYGINKAAAVIGQKNQPPQ